MLHTGIRPEDRKKARVIYLIWCNVSNKGYVGQTRKVLWRRWNAHKRVATAVHHSRCHALHAAIRKHGVDAFSVYVLEAGLPLEQIDRAEQWWIAALGTLSHMGTTGGYNLTSGGENGKIYSPETRAKISASNKGFVHSEATRRKMAASHTGKKRPPMSMEQRAKISAAKMGRPVPPEVRAKMSASHTGKPLSEDHKAKVAAAREAKGCSAETRRKLSIAHKGKKLTPEHRAKVSASRTGKKYGPRKKKEEAK